MSLLFFVNTNKIRNYSYIKRQSQCSFTSRETLRNNFSFHSNKGIHHIHIWYGGEPLACPLQIPHNVHVFYHNWASELPHFLSELTEEQNLSTTFSFLMQLVEHMIMVILLSEDAHGQWEIVLPFFKNQDFSFLL